MDVEMSDSELLSELDLNGFCPPVPLVKSQVPYPKGSGVYVVTSGDCVSHIGQSSRLAGRIVDLAALRNHRASAKVVCAAYCSGEAPVVRWMETDSVAEAKRLETVLHSQLTPPQPRPKYEGCINGRTLRERLIAAAGPGSWEAGYIEAVFDIGEQLHRLFEGRFARVWGEVGAVPGPWPNDRAQHR